MSLLEKKRIFGQESAIHHFWENREVWETLPLSSAVAGAGLLDHEPNKSRSESGGACLPANCHGIWSRQSDSAIHHFWDTWDVWAKPRQAARTRHPEQELAQSPQRTCD
jgi:hypothetical protein